MRSQYGFYWPEYYFTVFGEYGVRDYFYSPKSTDPWSYIGEGLMNWVFMLGEPSDDNLRGEITEHPKGGIRRTQKSNDIIIFSTTEATPLNYYNWYNGVNPTKVSEQSARGTDIQFSQIGGYREFSFVLKDRYRERTTYRSGCDYFGWLNNNDFSVIPVEIGEKEELFAHPSGFPVIIRGENENLTLEIGTVEDPRVAIGSISFDLFREGSWPDISFSRDGQTCSDKPAMGI